MAEPLSAGAARNEYLVWVGRQTAGWDAMTPSREAVEFGRQAWHAQEKRIAVLEAEREALRQALWLVEWIPGQHGELVCPDCDSLHSDGHKDGCGLAAALADATTDGKHD